MAIQRLDNVLIVVDDLDAVIDFFETLGLALDGRQPLDGEWVERVIGLDGVRQDVAVLRTPDGSSGVELARFHTPASIRKHRRRAGPAARSRDDSVTTP